MPKGRKLDDEEAAEPRRLPSWLWLGLGLLALGVFATALWWQARQQDAQLRAALTQTIEAEARALSSQNSVQIETYVDPNAPQSWRGLYLQAALLRPFTALPVLQDVTLADDGTLALVSVQLPRPEGELYAGLEPIMEQRAYRLVEGTWRRTPLPLDMAEPVEQRSAHFVLRGPADALATLNPDGKLLAELEALYDHLAATWPGEQFVAAPVIIEVQPKEFDELQDLGRQFHANVTQPIVINALLTFDADPEVPLPANTQHKLELAKAVVFRLTGNVPLPLDGIEPTPEAQGALLMLIFQLRSSEAQQAVLSPEQQRTFRNWWRMQLAGEWLSPLSAAFPLEATPELGKRQKHYGLSLALLAEQVRLAYNNGPFTQLADYTASAGGNFTMADAFLSVAGGTLEELERQARAFAQMME